MTDKPDELLNMYKHMALARRVDGLEASLAQQGEVFFYIPGSGHEGAAALAPHLIPEDWLHLHYRDKALALARGVTAKSMLDGLLSKETSNSKGRRMPGFPCDRSLNIMSTPTLVANNALQACGVAAVQKNNTARPLVLCSVGDGSTQQGEFLEALGEAVRDELPVLFLVEDNRYALSTPTAHRTPYAGVEQVLGTPVHVVDGADVPALDTLFKKVVSSIRETRKPQLVVMQCERLTSHTNADDQTVYRSSQDIQEGFDRRDPVKRLRDDLIEHGVSEETLSSIDEEIVTELQETLKRSRKEAEPAAAHDAKRPLSEAFCATAEYRGADEPRELTMLEAMRGVLKEQLQQDERVFLFGEDIEDPKGDVFGLTRGLSKAYPGRVRNSPLAEATIIGEAVGRSMAGQLPVAFLQFADFLPLAYNQIQAELGSLYWRSGGQWEAPMIIMAICGAYRPGLGPYHAQSPESVVAHVPGIDVFAPSNAADAAGLLNAAFASGRPSVFFYPKNLLNDRSAASVTSPDVEQHFVPIGKARVTRAGGDITIVTWGSTMPLCEEAAQLLEDENVQAEIIDLRSIFPWDVDTVLQSVQKTGRLLVVHEDNQTCGMGGEVVATICEKAGGGIQAARVTRSDTYVPYHYGNQLEILPSVRSITDKAADLCGYDVAWQSAVDAEEDLLTVKAIGSSPSDETIKVAQVHVEPGRAVSEGDLLLSVEADKASAEIAAPVDGTLEELLIKEGDSVSVGTPVLTIRTAPGGAQRLDIFAQTGQPSLTRRASAEAPHVRDSAASERASGLPVILNSICSAVGSRKMTNDEFLDQFPGWTSEDVMKRTGIEHRYWLGEDETVLTLAEKACRELLEKEQLAVSDLDMIICSTGTPLDGMTPSLACRILKELSPEKGEVMVQAYDINAACTGYLYALQAAYDTLKYDSSRKIMVVTAETLSPVLNHEDPNTLFIFGDAATASLISCEPRQGSTAARLHRPVLSALGVDKDILSVPFSGSSEYVKMEGQQVFRVAVRKMVDMLQKACDTEGVTIDELDMIVTHQANERIIEAARKMIKFPKERVFNQMRYYGNTSSNTIPIALQTVLPKMNSDEHVGLTAFGGGYTFGAAVVDVL